MASDILVDYRITITGRLRAGSGADAQQRLRDGLSMSLPLHESVDDLKIETRSSEEDLEEMRRRFR